MKIITPPARRTLAVLVPTLLVLAAPAAAQQVQTTTTPPPPVSVAPPPVVPTIRTAPAPAAPTVQSLPAPDVTPEPEATPARARTATVKRAAPARAAPARAAAEHTTQTRTATTTRAAAPAAPAAPAPAAPAPETPVAQTPAPVAAPVTDTAPATQPAPGAIADTSQTTTESAPVWPWIVAGIVGLLAIFGLVALSRRRKTRADAVYQEPVAYAEPVAEPAPLPVADPMVVAPAVAVAPVVSEEPKFLRPEPTAERAAAEPALSSEDGLSTAPDSAELVSADAADVDALTAGDPPVADRPWLEMSMRPMRAGTSAEDALVEIELTVGNAGSVAAKDVRISTFMFAGEPASGEMERMLTEHNADAVPAVTIEPGEGTTLEATLALSREALDGEVSPLIFADARYPLPGGGEGHTSAAFRIGISQEDGSITPIQIGKPHMTQTVDAELYGTPERV